MSTQVQLRYFLYPLLIMKKLINKASLYKREKKKKNGVLSHAKSVPPYTATKEEFKDT